MTMTAFAFTRSGLPVANPLAAWAVCCIRMAMCNHVWTAPIPDEEAFGALAELESAHR